MIGLQSKMVLSSYNRPLWSTEIIVWVISLVSGNINAKLDKTSVSVFKSYSAL